MYLTILRKELRQLFRDRWLCGGLVLFVVLVLASLTSGIVTYQSVATRQKSLQEAARQDWLSQDSKSGHSATHHGVLLYIHSDLLADLETLPHRQSTITIEDFQKMPDFQSAPADRTLSWDKLRTNVMTLAIWAAIPFLIDWAGFRSRLL